MKQDQKSYFYDLRKSRSGQAVVEYVLLMVVIVGLILGSAKIFKSIDKGMQKYIGDYFVCLMEYGELPTLGVSDADLKKHTGGTGRVCDNQFEAFSFEAGRPATAGGGGGSGKGGSSSQNPNSRSGSGSEDGRGGSGSDSSRNQSKNLEDAGAGDGTDLANRGRGSSRSSSRKPEVKKSGTGIATLDGGSSEESNTKVLEDDEGTASDKDKRKRRRPKRTQIGYAEDYRAIGGRALQEIEKTQRRRGTVRKPSSSLLKIVADEGLSGPTRKTVTPPQRQVAAEIKDKDSGFSFGALFKWLLIGGMIIAIIVFFGGQLLNYSNSD